MVVAPISKPTNEKKNNILYDQRPTVKLWLMRHQTFHISVVVILVCELDIGSSVIRWWMWSELLVSILMTPVSRLHSHRCRWYWLATSPVIHSLTSVVNYTLLMNTVFHCHSLKPSHHCSMQGSCCTIHCARSIAYHVYMLFTNRRGNKQRSNSYRVTNIAMLLHMIAWAHEQKRVFINPTKQYLARSKIPNRIETHLWAMSNKQCRWKCHIIKLSCAFKTIHPYKCFLIHGLYLMWAPTTTLFWFELFTGSGSGPIWSIILRFRWHQYSGFLFFWIRSTFWVTLCLSTYISADCFFSFQRNFPLHTQLYDSTISLILLQV